MHAHPIGLLGPILLVISRARQNRHNDIQEVAGSILGAPNMFRRDFVMKQLSTAIL